MARVLIVDDSPDSADPLARSLRKRGHRVTLADNARTAMALLIGDTPDFAIFDYRMPEMSGVELLRAMRSYLRLQDVPVMFLTAYPEAAELQELESLDVIGITPKINLKLADVAEIVELHERLSPPAQDPPPPHA
jgi:CheY-like chemotaxis protein